MIFVKWPKLLVWHVVRHDGMTVCGLLISLSVQQAKRRPARVCKQCDRMKGATSVRLANRGSE